MLFYFIWINLKHKSTSWFEHHNIIMYIIKWVFNWALDDGKGDLNVKIGKHLNI